MASRRPFTTISFALGDSETVKEVTETPPASDTHPGAHYEPPRLASRMEAVGVVIPARNRAATISQCILSIFAANSYSGWRNALWIVVVADACTDQTAKVARHTLGAFGEVLEVSALSLRTARRIGESSLLEHFRHQTRHGIVLASTLADAPVPRDWINILKNRKICA
jgi:glycosyltransferase involved in cell wall biosynthesis